MLLIDVFAIGNHRHIFPKSWDLRVNWWIRFTCQCLTVADSSDLHVASLAPSALLLERAAATKFDVCGKLQVSSSPWLVVLLLQLHYHPGSWDQWKRAHPLLGILAMMDGWGWGRGGWMPTLLRQAPVGRHLMASSTYSWAAGVDTNRSHSGIPQRSAVQCPWDPVLFDLPNLTTLLCMDQWYYTCRSNVQYKEQHHSWLICVQVFS